MIERSLLPLVLALLPCLALAAEVRKTERPEYRETVYSVAEEACEIRWSAATFEGLPGFGIAEHSRCPLPPERQIPLRSALLRAVMADTGRLEGLRSFEWGRLQRGDANDEYGLRLAQAAAKSGDWDKGKGKPRRDRRGLNHYVAQLLNRANIFPEVAATFAAEGFDLTVAGVEKVLVGPMPSPNGGTAGRDKLPFDCIVSFAVTPKSGASPGPAP